MKRSGKISIFLLLGLFAGGTLCASRIKDLTSVEGGRDNQLVGYGLVAGLAGDGDSRLNYTIQSIANSLKRFGITVPADKVKSDNMAAVIVTADIGPFMRSGSRIDVTVSSIGDAASLQGGVLLQTPLIGADGKVYAVAQGPVAVGGFIGGSGGAGGATVQKNHPTVGIISGGAIVERRIETSIVRDDGSMDLLLLNPDFTTSVRIADAINSVFPASTQAGDPGAGSELSGHHRLSGGPAGLDSPHHHQRAYGHHRGDPAGAPVQRGCQSRRAGDHDLFIRRREPAAAHVQNRADGDGSFHQHRC
jgi:flagellar P-ring protein precursor FlgI